MTTRRALLGIHDYALLAYLDILCDTLAYASSTVWSTTELLEQLAPNEPPYLAVFMDANLGNPQSTDFTPARVVWASLQEQERYRGGRVNFRAVSGWPEICRLAEEGIPVIYKENLSHRTLFPGEAPLAKPAQRR